MHSTNLFRAATMIIFGLVQVIWRLAWFDFYAPLGGTDHHRHRALTGRAA